MEPLVLLCGFCWASIFVALGWYSIAACFVGVTALVAYGCREYDRSRWQ